MSRHNDGCILIPFALIWYIVKLVVAVGAYALAGMMTIATLLWLPLIVLVALFKGDSDMIYTSLFMWFALAHEFVENLL